MPDIQGSIVNPVGEVTWQDLFDDALCSGCFTRIPFPDGYSLAGNVNDGNVRSYLGGISFAASSYNSVYYGNSSIRVNSRSCQFYIKH